MYTDNKSNYSTYRTSTKTTVTNKIPKQANTVSSMNVKFDNGDPSSWNKYQSSMREQLFALSRETDPIKIDSTIENWISLAKNGTEFQCVSMYSVISYFYPGKISTSYFKERIGYFRDALSLIITNKRVSGEQPKEEKTVAKKNETPAKSKKVVDKEKSFTTDFPSFDDGGFPDTNSDIFDKLLERNEIPSVSSGDDSKSEK